ncbi:MAG: phosphopeptide-binding protein [Bacteroidetes bacterium]|nr:MAG: phosphopeptide-binding protein [Bacteroidota bacterium]
MKKLLFALFIMNIFLVSCKTDTANQESETEQTSEVEETNKYTLTAFTPSASFPDAKLESMEYQEGTFNYAIGGEGYKLKAQTPDADQKMCANSGEGQHIHLIVDNMPYAAKYVNSFDYEVADGEHYILSFLSRSYHESIKSGNAHIAVKAKVENGSITESKPLDAKPMLFYSRPKGTYVGQKDTEKVMLDFFLVNADLGNDYKVKAEINGEEHIIDTWQPYYIEGMEMGENTIILTLINKDGSAVDTPLNPVERTFTLKPDPTE